MDRQLQGAIRPSGKVAARLIFPLVPIDINQPSVYPLDMKKLLNLPLHVIPLALVPVGYPAEEKPRGNGMTAPG
ncbi:MAG: hypothetical protein WA610_11560 [Thermodesulfovibrionales bacterium]